MSAKIVTNAKTPGAKCYGFVTMMSSEDASKCISQLNHTELHGRMIQVEKVRPIPFSKRSMKIGKKPTCACLSIFPFPHSLLLQTSAPLARLCISLNWSLWHYNYLLPCPNCYVAVFDFIYLRKNYRYSLTTLTNLHVCVFIGQRRTWRPHQNQILIIVIIQPQALRIQKGAKQ